LGFNAKTTSPKYFVRGRMVILPEAILFNIHPCGSSSTPAGFRETVKVNVS
jgi:hypothetical protein